jgi:hypothetical protein
VIERCEMIAKFLMNSCFTKRYERSKIAKTPDLVTIFHMRKTTRLEHEILIK